MNRKIHVSVESIMVILLMILFAISISVLIFNGSVTYRNIIDNKNQEENIRIALSYVNMRIKQNDMSDRIVVTKEAFKGEDVLSIYHHGDEEGLVSHIYYADGYPWECYTEGPIDHYLSSEIIDIQGIRFDMDEEGRWVTSTLEMRNNKDNITLTQLTALRTETN